MDKSSFASLMSEVQNLPDVPGLLMTDVLNLPLSLRQFLTWLLRKKGAELEEIVAYLEGLDPQAAKDLMEELEHKGCVEFVELSEYSYYRVRTRAVAQPTRDKTRRDLWHILNEDPSSLPGE